MENDTDITNGLSRVAGRVRSLAETCQFGFWFITDLHVPSNLGKSGEMLERLIGETGVRHVVSGGDIPEAFGDRAALDDAIGRYRAGWVAPIERAGGLLLPLHGNHDFTTRDAPDADTGFTYPQSVTRAMVLDTAAVRRGAVADPASCACYLDCPEARVRIVGVDTHDAIDTSRQFWGVADGISPAQLGWLRDVAFGTLPDGWRAVVASHAPFAGVAALEHERGMFAPFCEMLAPFAADGRVQLAISGHHHGERQSRVGGIWHVTEPCDAAYLDYIHGSQPWVRDLPEKKPGTWAGQTFDAVQLDFERGLAHFTRVGGGADRTLHLAPLKVAAGGTLALSAQVVAAPVEWGCHDAGSIARIPNPARKYDYFYEYSNLVAEVGRDGALAAKTPGSAVAIATAADGTREYFPVEVL